MKGEKGMKKLLLLFIFLSSVSIYSKSESGLATFEDKSNRVCIICKKPLSIAQVLIIQMLSQEKSPEYICEKCREEEKGYGDEVTLTSVFKPSYERPSHPPVLADSYYPIVRPSPDPGYTSEAQELKEFEKKHRKFKKYLDQDYIQVKLSNDYGVQIKRGSNLPLFLLHKPFQEKPSVVGLPLDRLVDNGKGKLQKAGIRVVEVIPLADTFLFIPEQDQSLRTLPCIYSYNPKINQFSRLEPGEMLHKIKKFDHAVAKQHGLLSDKKGRNQ
jgi:hypothetical protein